MKAIRIILASLIYTLVSLNGYAQTKSYFNPDQIDIPYTRYVLDNGLTLIVHEDHKAPIVAVNIWYHVGSKNEKPGRTGTRHRPPADGHKVQCPGGFEAAGFRPPNPAV